MRKAYEPRKEDIYDLKNIAVFAIILGILGVLVFGIGLATEIIELFLGGFILGGLSEWISIFGLVKIYKITRKFPELKPKNGERNIKFTNPYLSKPDPNAELKSLRKARTIALWLFWLCYVVVGFGFLAVLGVFIRQ